MAVHQNSFRKTSKTSNITFAILPFSIAILSTLESRVYTTIYVREAASGKSLSQL